MHPLHELSLDDLRRRTSIKWRMHGPDVIPMFVAEMDVALAEPVARALRDAVDLGDTGYPQPRVYAEALADFAAARWGWDGLDPDRTLDVADVMVGIEEVLRLTGGPDVPVVLNPPVYPPFFDAVAHVGRPVVEVPLAPDGRLDLAALAHAFEAHPGCTYLLCSPHNPTAVVHSHDELATVARLAAEHRVRVVVDEIHAPLAPVRPDGVAFVPYLSVPGTDDAYAVLSASKAFNLAGLKAAVVAGGAATAAELASVPEIVSHGPSHLGTIAHVAALTHGRDWLDALQADVAANRALLHELVAAHLPGAQVLAGPGTYTAWLDLRSFDLGDDPATVLLERSRVALAPGPTFGGTSRVGDGFARLTYATPPDVLREALERLGRAVA
jgi:cystathionine beta-lyase